MSPSTAAQEVATFAALPVHPDEDEDYSAMTNALSKDPFALYNQLKAHKEGLERRLQTVKARRDVRGVRELNAALEQVDLALTKTVAHLNKFTAAVDDVDEEDDVIVVSAADKKKPKKPHPDEGADDEAADAHADDDNDGDGEDSDENESPVAMQSKLRKAMGDAAADYLDEYASDVYGKVVDFFDSLEKEELELDGEEDDDESLRGRLKEEIGTRGLEQLEPVFPEWKAGLVKAIMKMINDRFAPPEEETEDENGEKQSSTAPPTPEKGAGKSGAGQVGASAGGIPTGNGAVGRVAGVVRDFRPSGVRTTRLS